MRKRKAALSGKKETEEGDNILNSDILSQYQQSQIGNIFRAKPQVIRKQKPTQTRPTAKPQIIRDKTLRDREKKLSKEISKDRLTKDKRYEARASTKGPESLKRLDVSNKEKSKKLRNKLANPFSRPDKPSTKDRKSKDRKSKQAQTGLRATPHIIRPRKDIEKQEKKKKVSTIGRFTQGFLGKPNISKEKQRLSKEQKLNREKEISKDRLSKPQLGKEKQRLKEKALSGRDGLRDGLRAGAKSVSARAAPQSVIEDAITDMEKEVIVKEEPGLLKPLSMSDDNVIKPLGMGDDNVISPDVPVITETTAETPAEPKEATATTETAEPKAETDTKDKPKDEGKRPEARINNGVKEVKIYGNWVTYDEGNQGILDSQGYETAKFDTAPELKDGIVIPDKPPDITNPYGVEGRDFYQRSQAREERLKNPKNFDVKYTEFKTRNFYNAETNTWDKIETPVVTGKQQIYHNGEWLDLNAENIERLKNTPEGQARHAESIEAYKIKHGVNQKTAEQFGGKTFNILTPKDQSKIDHKTYTEKRKQLTVYEKKHGLTDQSFRMREVKGKWIPQVRLSGKWHDTGALHPSNKENLKIFKDQGYEKLPTSFEATRMARDAKLREAKRKLAKWSNPATFQNMKGNMLSLIHI